MLSIKALSAPSKPLTETLRGPLRIYKGDDESIQLQKIFANKTGSVIVQTSSMELEELEEKHLQEALVMNADIPVPDVIEIDEELYETMYPANVLKPNSLIYELTEEKNNQFEYDIDLNDAKWIKEKNIDVNTFEKAIEILEESCSKENKTPKVDDLSILSKLKPGEDEAIFDYWLDKCLSQKSKLTSQLKTEKKQRWTRSIDNPYVAFRKCPDKIITRKNRSQDHFNYMMMVEYRRQLAYTALFYKKTSLHDKARRSFLQAQLEIFKEQYQNRTFNVEFLSNDWRTNLSLEHYIEAESASIQNTSDRASDLARESEDNEESFKFERQAMSEYFEPVADFMSGDPERDLQAPQKYSLSSKGFIRQRLGRGGRILFDRRQVHNLEAVEPEVEQASIYTEVRLKKLPHPFDSCFLKSEFGVSSFKLQNSTKPIYNEALNEASFYF